MPATADDYTPPASRKARRNGPKVFAIYCRISDDKDGLGDGVAGQEAWGRAYAAEHFPGLPVEVFCDNDLTAADANVERPDYNRLCEWIRAGRVAEVWAIEQRRIERTWRWFAFAAMLEDAGITRLHTRRRGVVRLDDLGTDVDAVVGVHEVRENIKRTRDRKTERAREGRPSGGPQFGYRPGKDGDGRKTLELDPTDAAILEVAWSRVEAGESMTATGKAVAAVDGTDADAVRAFFADHLDDVRRFFPEGADVEAQLVAELAERRSIRGATGGKVGQMTIRTWLTSPTVAGLVQHKGELLRDADGELLRARWLPIIDVARWEAMQLRVAALKQTHARACKRARPGNQRYMLSGANGVGVCECGGTMFGTRKRRAKGSDVFQQLYMCGDCGSRMDGETVDRIVTERLLERLDFLADLLAEDAAAADRDDIAEQLDALDARRRVLSRKFGEGTMDEDDYDEAIAGVKTTKAALVKALAELPPAPPKVIDADVIRQAWDGMSVRERRDVIGRCIARVVIRKVRPGEGRRINPDRVRIEGPGWTSDNGDDGNGTEEAA